MSGCIEPATFAEVTQVAARRSACGTEWTRGSGAGRPALDSHTRRRDRPSPRAVPKLSFATWSETPTAPSPSPLAASPDGWRRLDWPTPSPATRGQSEPRWVNAPRVTPSTCASMESTLRRTTRTSCAGHRPTGSASPADSCPSGRADHLHCTQPPAGTPGRPASPRCARGAVRTHTGGPPGSAARAVPRRPAVSGGTDLAGRPERPNAACRRTGRMERTRVASSRHVAELEGGFCPGPAVAFMTPGARPAIPPARRGRGGSAESAAPC